MPKIVFGLTDKSDKDLGALRLNIGEGLPPRGIPWQAAHECGIPIGLACSPLRDSTSPAPVSSEMVASSGQFCDNARTDTLL